LHGAHARDVEKARLEGLISDAEAQQLRAAADAVAAAVAVDDFAPEALSPRQSAADVIPVKWNPFKRQTRSRRSSLGGGWGCRCRCKRKRRCRCCYGSGAVESGGGGDSVCPPPRLGGRGGEGVSVHR